MTISQSNDWKILCLEVDKESKEVGRFIGNIWPSKILCFHQSEICWNASKMEISLKELMKLEGRIFTVYGNGFFHNFTYGLVKNIGDVRSNAYSYVHIDQHTDTNDQFMKLLTCANFVNFIPIYSNGRTVRHIGIKHVLGHVPSSDILKADEITDSGMVDSLEKLMCGTVDDAYVSMDLDVLLPNEMQTAYPGGNVDLSTFLQVIDWLKVNKRIISADALGFADLPSEFGSKYMKEKSLLVYAMIAATLFGEDRTVFKKEHERLMKY